MATASPAINNPATQREDNWWLEPLLIFLGLGAFALYGTGRALMGFWDAPGEASFLTADHAAYLANAGYLYHEQGAHYISPLASPDLSIVLAPIIKLLIDPLRNLTGWPALVLSPALWILWAPGGFRVTCYYYRKAYYRSFFAGPPACAASSKEAPFPINLVSKLLHPLLGKGDGYRGESVFPLIMQNLHRYFFYVAALFILILSVDALIACFFEVDTVSTVVRGQAVERHVYAFGIRFGSIVLALNVLLLALYTFSCHSWRHLLGGMLDNFSSCGAVGMMRNHAWQRQSLLNEHHMFFAWISLFWVGFTDLYVLAIAKGWWDDIILLPNVGRFMFPYL